ncbi:hypothetical protein AWENTII_008791 [Aspergillus wentii]
MSALTGASIGLVAYVAFIIKVAHARESDISALAFDAESSLAAFLGAVEVIFAGLAGFEFGGGCGGQGEKGKCPIEMHFL